MGTNYFLPISICQANDEAKWKERFHLDATAAGGKISRKGMGVQGPVQAADCSGRRALMAWGVDSAAMTAPPREARAVIMRCGFMARGRITWLSGLGQISTLQADSPDLGRAVGGRKEKAELFYATLVGWALVELQRVSSARP